MIGHQEAFENAARSVLCVMLLEHAQIGNAQFKYNLEQGHFPKEPKELPMLYMVLCDLFKRGEPIQFNTVLSRGGAVITSEWLSLLYSEYSEAISANFASDCELVAAHGLRYGMIRIYENVVKQLLDFEGKPTTDIMNQAVSITTTVHTHNGVDTFTAGDLAREFRVMMTLEQEPTQSTGLAFLDGLSGGFAAGDIWWVVGAYKMRKTTLMLNMLLHATMEGHSVTFLSREMRQQQVSAQLIAMLANGYLLEMGQFESRTNAGNPLNWISGRSIISARRGINSWDVRKTNAVNHAIDTYEKLSDKLRIYDQTKDGGRLSDVASAQMLIKRDKSLFGCEMVFIDYLQLFSMDGASAYEQASYASKAFQEAGKVDDVTMVIAAQQNESAVGSQLDSYSPGVKGGGDAAATADFLIRTRYKSGADLADETKLEVFLMLSRHSSGGLDSKQVVNIHPSSGLILDSEYAQKSQRKGQVIFGTKTS